MNDELMMLWQQGTSAEPDAAEVARLAGRATMTRFDGIIKRRNFMEYAAGAILLIVGAVRLWSGAEPVQPLLLMGSVSFVMVYLWNQHRHLAPLDVAADARSYQAAMLQRIDQQMRLLSSVRYWYLLPLSIPVLWQTATMWRRSPGRAIISLAVVTAVFAAVAWLNERAGIARLRAARAKIEALYRD